MDPATREAKRTKLIEKINNGQLVELDESDWESEEEDKWNDQQYIKAEEEDLIWALKQLWRSACKQDLPVSHNEGDFYLVWFACVEVESEDCNFECQKIDQCNLETQNNNWNSGAQWKQRGDWGTHGWGTGGRGKQTLQSGQITAVLLGTPLTSTTLGKRAAYYGGNDDRVETRSDRQQREARDLGIHKYEPRKRFLNGVWYTGDYENRPLLSSPRWRPAYHSKSKNEKDESLD